MIIAHKSQLMYSDAIMAGATGWWRFYKLNLERGADWGSIWLALSQLGLSLTNLNYLSILLLLIGFTAIAIFLFEIKSTPTLAGNGGVGAKVLDYLPGEGLLVISYIKGKTYGAEDVAANLSRIATSLRTLHALDSFDHEFNMFTTQKNYQAIVQEQGFRLPEGYLDFGSKVDEIKKAMSVLFEGLVPCNNDLLPGNFIDDGQKIWLIDYEYSGNNDACFEIGNVWAEAFLPIDALEVLVSAYYGEYRPDKVARAWLWALMAKYGWTLWASIQSSVSDLDFDFWEWGMSKYDLASSEFTSDYFKSALTIVATPPR